MRRQCSWPFLPGLCFGEDFVDDKSRNCSRQGAECDVVGQFSWIPGVHTANTIEWLIAVTRYWCFDTPCNWAESIRCEIVESPVVFGRGHNRPFNTELMQPPPQSSVPGGPPGAQRPASAGRDVRQWLNYVALTSVLEQGITEPVPRT